MKKNEAPKSLAFDDLGPVKAFYSLCGTYEKHNEELVIKMEKLVGEHEAQKNASHTYKSLPFTTRIDYIIDIANQIQRNHQEIINQAKEVIKMFKEHSEIEE